VIEAERSRRLFRECIAVTLPVSRANERGDDLEVPVVHVDSFTPEIREADVDVELEQIDAGGFSGHADERTHLAGRTSQSL